MGRLPVPSTSFQPWEGFEVVVVGADVVEPPEQGDAGLGPVAGVVSFQVGAVTAFGDAVGSEPFQGGLLVGGGCAAEVGDVDHVHAFGDHRGQEDVAAGDHGLDH